ncbi:MAG: dTDP-4-dehydrorhamnose reductase [Alphaproteobacteria bacterium]|nr:dTDP-4-dehydrorhamnose reductase [Alphaproteobacteria bacterium]
MRVLVTGATGQVGGALARAVAPEGIELVTVGRDRLDLARPGTIDGALDSIRPDIVVNPAAYTAVDKAETEPDLARAVNAEGPGALAAACSERRVGLIHLSTDYVFDGSGIRPYRPDDPVAPLGVYGATKQAGERAIRQVLEDHLILRTAWVYAARGQNFVSTMLRVGADRDVLRVVADQHGTPTAAVDIAAAILAILAARRDGTVLTGTHHYTAEGTTTWHGMAEAIFARAAVHWGRRPVVEAITTEQYPTPAARPAYSVLDNSSLDAVVAVPRRPWQEALDAVLDDRLGPRPVSPAVMEGTR